VSDLLSFEFVQVYKVAGLSGDRQRVEGERIVSPRLGIIASRRVRHDYIREFRYFIRDYARPSGVVQFAMNIEPIVRLPDSDFTKTLKEKILLQFSFTCAISSKNIDAKLSTHFNHICSSLHLGCELHETEFKSCENRISIWLVLVYDVRSIPRK
jgi:hypothetical protein